MTNKQLIRFIRAEITRRGISVQKLADKSGIPYATIYHWRTHVESPRIDSVIKVLDALNLELKVVRKVPHQP